VIGKAERASVSFQPRGLHETRERPNVRILRKCQNARRPAPEAGESRGLLTNYCQHAISINDQYRICFRWKPDGVHRVEITDYH